MIGRTISHYRITEKLGEGGMGAVYKAHDTLLNRTVAIKILPDAASSDPDRRRRFIQEARAASALDHPNIITIYDIAEVDGRHVIIMQYVAGKTLRQALQEGPLPLPDALDYAIQTANALAAAHAAGIVHRDLKPENVMITERGVVKLVDFGIAKLLERPLASPEESTATLPAPAFHTTQGVIVGTAAYMSPEQAEGRPVDARSDIFSFGAVLYEMAAGRRAFPGDSAISVLAAVLRAAPAPIAGISGDLDRIITRCLEKDPDRRIQSIDEAKSALENLDRPSTRLRLPSRRVLLAAAGSLAVAVAAVSAWLLFRSQAPPGPMRTVPLTSFAGEEYEPALSPDGRQIAFVWNGPDRDNHDIYVKLVEAGTPLRLTTHAAVDSTPAWSPDGLFLAFYRDVPGGNEREVYVVPALSGPERRVGVARGRTVVASLMWSADGKGLFIVDSPAPQQPIGISFLSIDTGEKRAITAPPQGTFPGDARFALSPDGRTLAFVRLEGSQYGRRVLLQSLTGDGHAAGAPVELASNLPGVAGIDWGPDGRTVIYSVRGGGQSLWSIPVRSGRPAGRAWPFAAVGENATTLTVARRTNRLAYTRYIFDINIWRVAASAEPVRFIASTREDRMPSWSPGGDRIVFVSERSGNREVWVSGSQGAEPVQLTTFNGANILTPRWSPDGKIITFAANPRGSWDVYTISAGGGAARPLLSDSTDENAPCFSRDGRWLYFASTRGGVRQIWKVPADGGTPVQITRNGGNQAMEAPHDGTLYYTRPNAQGIWTVDAGGNEKQVLNAGEIYNWTVTPSGFFILDARAKPAPLIQFFRFGSARPAQIAVLPRGIEVRDLAVSPDERSFLYAHAEQPDSDLMLVENIR